MNIIRIYNYDIELIVSIDKNNFKDYLEYGYLNSLFNNNYIKINVDNCYLIIDLLKFIFENKLDERCIDFWVKLLDKESKDEIDLIYSDFGQIDDWQMSLEKIRQIGESCFTNNLDMYYQINLVDNDLIILTYHREMNDEKHIYTIIDYNKFIKKIDKILSINNKLKQIINDNYSDDKKLYHYLMEIISINYREVN